MSEEERHIDIIDHNIVGEEYVTYIVDMWAGDRTDPAVDITRYLGCWNASDLVNADGESNDPDFWGGRDRYSYYTRPTPRPITWETLGEKKKGQSDAKSFKKIQETLTGDSYGSSELYKKFLDAIDTVAGDPDNEAAWAAIDAYRRGQALQYEH
jgi:hypothetical protein